MTETKDTAAHQDEPVEAAAAVVGDDGSVQALGAVAVQGNQAIVVAQFADMDSAKAAYYALLDAEVKRAVDIDGVLVECRLPGQGPHPRDDRSQDPQRVPVGRSRRRGHRPDLPPTILAGAVAVGVAGAAVGKAGNVLMKSDVADELASVIAPGTSGIVALVSITAVDAVEATIPDAKVVKSAPVSDETAAAVKQAAKAGGSSAS